MNRRGNTLRGACLAARESWRANLRAPRAGDRQLNYALHVMPLAQIRHDGPGQAYYPRKRAAGKSHKEAMRCLTRRLSDVVYRTMINDSVSSLAPTAWRVRLSILLMR